MRHIRSVAFGAVVAMAFSGPPALPGQARITSVTSLADIMAAAIDGEWDAAVNTPGGVVHSKIIFKVSGDSLTGTVRRQAGDVPLVGTFESDVVKFTYTVTYNENPLQLSVTATVHGDQMKGTIAFGAQAEGEWSATRAKP